MPARVILEWRESTRARLLLGLLLAVFLTGFLYFPSTRLHSDFYYLFVLLPFLVLASRADWRALLGAPTVQLAALLIAYLLLTLTWREDAAELGLYDPLRHALLTWSLVVVAAFVTASRPHWLVELAPLLAIAAVAVTALSLLLFYQENPFPGARLQNQVGLRDNPIGGTVPMGMIALAGLAALLTEGSRARRLVGGVGAVAATLFILATQSRSLLLGVIVGAIVLLALQRYWRTLGGLALAAAAIVVVIEVTPDVRGLVGRGDSYRFLIWSDALSLIRQAPWLGHGFNAELSFDMGHRYTDSSHNIWLTAWLQGGVIGFLLLGALVGRCGVIAWHCLDRPEGRIAIAIFCLALIFTFFNVHNIVSRFSPHLSTSLWLAVGLLGGLEIRRYRELARTSS